MICFLLVRFIWMQLTGQDVPTTTTTSSSTSPTPSPSPSPAPSDVQAQAVDLCKQKKPTYSAVNWEKGPCLTNDINGTKYAVDIAHKPRQTVDDNNTCASPTKWVELDTSCNIINVQN